MRIKIEVEKIKEMLVLALLFMASMNFNAKFFYFVFLSFLVVLVTQRCMAIDTVSIIYLLLCITMAIYNFGEGLLSMLRCFAPLCFYLVGLNLVSDDLTAKPKIQKRNDPQKMGYSVLVTISLGSFSHYFLNYVYNLGFSLGRNTNDIWTGQIMAATGQNALACLMLGLACTMLFLPPRKWHRWAALAIISLMLMYNLVLSCRTMLAILCILLLIGMVYPKQNTSYGAQLLKCMTYFALLGGAVMVLYTLNIGGFRDYIQDSTLFLRFNGSITSLTDVESRSSTKLAFISHMISYPFGGCHMRKTYGYAHDLLLDAYDEYGIIVFLLMIVVLIISIVHLYVLLRRTDYSESFKLSLLLIYCAVLLEFTVEPILAGMSWLFSCYCLINGCTIGMNRAYIWSCQKERTGD